MPISIAALCQTGNLEAAYRQARAALAERPNSQFAQNDLYTAVLACLKKYVGQADATATARWVRKLAALGLLAHMWRDEQVCWELRNLLMVLARRQQPPHTEIADLLNAVVSLQLVPEASTGRSRLLQASLKFKEQLPADWWSWWNLDLLRPEDFEKESFIPADTGKPIRMPALAESAYGAYAKNLLKRLAAGANGIADSNGPASAARADAEALLPRLEALATAHSDYAWLGYYRAKLLVALGNTAAALPTLLPLVRQKSSEYWAWQLLAETLRPTDPAEALACYFRATQCSADEMYLGRLRETLASMLHEAGHFGAAQEQLRRLMQTKQAEAKELPYAARQLAAQPWFGQIHPVNKTLASTLLVTAEQAAYGDLPWQPVVLQFISEATAEKSAMARLLPEASGLSEPRALSVPVNKYRWLGKLPVGAPLQVRSESVAGRLKVVQVKERADGQPWDVVPAQIAVISGVTLDKARAFFSIRPGLNGAIQLAELKLTDVTPGDAVRIRLQSRLKDGATRHFVLAAEPTTALPDISVCRNFKGKLRMHEKGFGFADNIFLPAQIITQRGWAEGDEVSGKAVLSHNKAKTKDEWTAVQTNYPNVIG